MRGTATRTTRRVSSLLCYGPHAVHRSDPDVAVTCLAWGEGGGSTLDILRGLAEREPAPMGYPSAAQIECMLAEVIARLGTPGGGEDRPVLVTIGARTAFPRLVNPSRIIPCQRNDWRDGVLWLLSQYPGIRFGAIRDRIGDDGSHRSRGSGDDDEVWRALGAAAFAWLDAVDVPRFAEALDLQPPLGPPMPASPKTPQEMRDPWAPRPCLVANGSDARRITVWGAPTDRKDHFPRRAQRGAGTAERGRGVSSGPMRRRPRRWPGSRGRWSGTRMFPRGDPGP